MNKRQYKKKCKKQFNQVQKAVELFNNVVGAMGSVLNKLVYVIKKTDLKALQLKLEEAEKENKSIEERKEIIKKAIDDCQKEN